MFECGELVHDDGFVSWGGINSCLDTTVLARNLHRMHDFMVGPVEYKPVPTQSEALKISRKKLANIKARIAHGVG